MTLCPTYRWLYHVRRDGLLVTTGELVLITPDLSVAKLRVAEYYRRLNPAGVAARHETQITERHPHEPVPGVPPPARPTTKFSPEGIRPDLHHSGIVSAVVTTPPLEPGAA